MHLNPIKTASELKLNGVAVEFTTEGNDVKEVILTAHGQRFVMKPGEGYSNKIQIFRADKFKMEKRHVLSGEFCGVKVNEIFEDSYGAKNRKTELSEKGEVSGLTITEKEVPIDASAVVIPASDQVPF
jgi:hypothetical protein